MKLFLFIFILSLPVFAADLYHGYPEMEAALNNLAAQYPELVTLSVPGFSIEKRNLTVISIGKKRSDPNSPSVFFVGGLHARERIASEFPLLLVLKILKNKSDPRIQSILSSITIHLMPIANPDGVEFDREGSVRKSWRKNRRDNGEGAFGVDLNRNFGFGWGNEGASSSPFSDIFKGTTPFSEPETVAIRDFTLSHPGIRLMQNYHSYGELIYYPWGSQYLPIKDQRDLKTHRDLAEMMGKLTGYTPLQTSSAELVTGDMCDWAYGVKKIICFGIEFDPKDYDNVGHYLPYHLAAGVLEKNWEATLKVIEWVKEKNVH